MTKDYYSILGVERSANDDDIKKAYRKMALKYHPDRLVNASEQERKNAEDKLKEISEAYSVLKDPQKRQQYDNFGSYSSSGKGGGFSDFDVSDIFNSFFGEGNDVFGDFFGRSTHNSRQSSKGENLKITIKATLEDIALGTTKKIKITHFVKCKECNGTGSSNPNNIRTCSACNGTGRVKKVVRTIFGSMSMSMSECDACHGTGKINTSPCLHCHGEGREKINDTIDITLPAGIDETMQFSVRGGGNAGKFGGVTGDLYVQIQQIEHDKFRRKGADIYGQITISFPEAILGCEKIVDTLYGQLKIKIAPGTQSGEYLKFANKGLRNINTYGYGSHYLYIQVYTPKKVTAEEKKILLSLQGYPDFTPQENNKNNKSFFDKLKNWF